MQISIKLKDSSIIFSFSFRNRCRFTFILYLYFKYFSLLNDIFVTKLFLFSVNLMTALGCDLLTSIMLDGTPH